MKHISNWLIGAVGTLTAFLVGCGVQPAAAPPADPETARAALANALDAWKTGATLDSLTGQSPPVYVADEDWQNSCKLLKYKVDGAGVVRGLALTIPVELQVTDPKGRTQDKRVVYIIGTQPNNISIVRNDDAPEPEK